LGPGKKERVDPGGQKGQEDQGEDNDEIKNKGHEKAGGGYLQGKTEASGEEINIGKGTDLGRKQIDEKIPNQGHQAQMEGAYFLGRNQNPIAIGPGGHASQSQKHIEGQGREIKIIKNPGQICQSYLGEEPAGQQDGDQQGSCKG